MADVVMIYPKTGFDVQGGSVDLPMSILAASTLVAREFSVSFIDQRVDPDWRKRLLMELCTNPICVGISCMTGPQIHHALEAAQIVQDVCYGTTPVVFGGVHPTLLPYQTVSHPLVDYVVRGEGEQTFLELVRKLVRNESPDKVTEPSAHLELSYLPPPPYHLLPVGPYIGSQGRFHDPRTRSLIFFGSRGCPYKCGYCCNSELHHGSWRAMDAEEMYSRASALVGEYSLDAIMFHDEDLFLDHHRVEKLADLIRGKFQWWAQVRMDSLLRVDIDRLYQGGLRYIQAGIESGSPRILSLIRKGETVDDMARANRLLARTRIRPLYNFMMGFPTETYEDIMQSVDFATQLLRENPLAEVTGFYGYVPYPGTDLYALSMKHGFVPPNTLEGWASFTRQSLSAPWQRANLTTFRSIMTMSKLVDGTRMVRRLRDHSGYGKGRLALVKWLSKFYRRRWLEHKFNGTPFTDWIGRKVFHW